MSAVLSRHYEAGQLLELLTPKSRPRSPLNISHNPLGRAGSLRRSRNSPSSSPSMAAERELSTLLGAATPKHKVAAEGERRTAFPASSPETTIRSPELSPRPQRVPTCSFNENQQPQTGQRAPQTRSSPPETSLSSQNANHTTANYLSCDATQTQFNTINHTNEVTVKPTSDANQQSDHNNNGNDRSGLGFSNQGTLSDHRSGLRGEVATMNKADQELRGPISCSDQKNEHSTAAAGNMSVVLEKCTLVPELKAFDKATTRTSHSEGPRSSRLRGCPQDDVVIVDLEQEGADRSQVQETQNNSQIGNTENTNVQSSETNSSSLQREEEEAREEKVIVWCVTGVCEAAGELTHSDNSHAQTEEDPCRGDNQGGSQQASSAPANSMPSEPQPANEKPVPIPISSQPVPVSRCDDPSHPVTSPRWCPVDPASANEGSRLTSGASEEAKETANQEEEVEGSTNEMREVETVPEQSLSDDRSRNETPSCHTTNEKTEAATSTNGKAELAPSSKPSTRSLPTSKTRPAGMKTVTPNASSAASKSKPVRTLTSSENQGMRRVVPISKASRGAPSLGKRPEKPPGNLRGSSSTATPASLTVSNLNSTSLRRGDRPSTAPSSRRSSINRTPDAKDSKDQKVSGPQASAREQNHDLQRKPSIRKPLTKPKAQQEEKMCRSTLRALTQGDGGGGSISAPATPLHKGSAPSSLPLPNFARSTASSSFRRSHTTLGPPHSSHTGSDSSPKSISKTTSSSIAPPGTSSPLTRTGSMRLSATSRSSDLLYPSSSSPLRRSQSIRIPPRSPLQNSLVPPKGHRPNDSGAYSDKSAHSRDPAKSVRPSWK